ncbi:hypothetical protein HNR19_002501 [Nocardioides thalensis]|uniref:Secreted protein n=1 Tax=Nocardioides thalensis TaxID=1914755 RepID=A0A853C6F5_9ACTN|nr:hypothetical protein [Nocardioides thalensis]NYJ01803.1 hypothetical protein [Nocardioides thalensis]
MESFRAIALTVRRTLLVAALGAAPLLATTGTASPAGAAEPDGPAWEVVDHGDGSFEVSWTSGRRFPTTSDRPTIVGDGLDFGPPTVSADGRTVTASVTADAAPEAADLDVVLSGDRLDEPGFDPSAVGTATPLAERATTALEAADPGLPGAFEIVSSDYELPGVKLPGMPQPIEMVGHVVEPAAGAETGPRPLVLFLHGRHSVCYNPDDPDDGGGRWPCQAPAKEIPSHLGYDHTQRILATQGYATVSIRVNGINAQDHRLADGGADARAAIVQEHLDHWVTLAGEHQVDMDQVVLVGHSRGGEGVDRAAIQIGPGAPYDVVGQVLLAPVDFAWHTAPGVPTVTVLPYCDGDVFDLQGQRFTDVARDLAPGDTSLKSSVLVMGANHNYFNSEWTPSTAAAPSWDDWGGERDKTCGTRHEGRLSAREQRSVGTAYVAGAVRLFTGEDDYLPQYDGSPVHVPSVGDAEVLSHAIGGGRSMRRPGIDATRTLPSGAETQLCTGVVTYESAAFGMCGRDSGRHVAPHWASQGDRVPTRRFLEMSWEAAGATGGLRFSDPLDLTADRLELRVILDVGYAAPDLQVRVSDSSGGTALLDPVTGTEPIRLPRMSYGTKLWAQALLVDASAATGVDLADITAVELVASNAEGRLWVTDLASAPAVLPAPPADALPQVDIGTISVEEGDKGTHTAKVPYTITGAVTDPARFVAITAGEERGSSQRVVIDVAPGQTSGTIPLTWVGDTYFSRARLVQITAWPLTGIATDDYIGGLRIVEDDPEPVITVDAPRRVVEGKAIEVTISSDIPLGRAFRIYASADKGKGEPLRGSDVPATWLAEHSEAADDRVGRPLWRLHVWLRGRIQAGETSTTLRIPTVADGRKEGAEFLDLDLWMNDRPEQVRVKVVDAG